MALLGRMVMANVLSTIFRKAHRAFVSGKTVRFREEKLCSKAVLVEVGRVPEVWESERALPDSQLPYDYTSGISLSRVARRENWELWVGEGRKDASEKNGWLDVGD
jgi:hypothetical protein